MARHPILELDSTPYLEAAALVAVAAEAHAGAGAGAGALLLVFNGSLRNRHVYRIARDAVSGHDEAQRRTCAGEALGYVWGTREVSFGLQCA